MGNFSTCPEALVGQNRAAQLSLRLKSGSQQLTEVFVGDPKESFYFFSVLKSNSLFHLPEKNREEIRDRILNMPQSLFAPLFLPSDSCYSTHYMHLQLSDFYYVEWEMQWLCGSIPSRLSKGRACQGTMLTEHLAPESCNEPNNFWFTAFPKMNWMQVVCRWNKQEKWSTTTIHLELCLLACEFSSVTFYLCFWSLPAPKKNSNKCSTKFTSYCCGCLPVLKLL